MEGLSATLALLRTARPVVFVNPRAGGGRARTYVAAIQEWFRSFQIAVQLKTTGSAEELQFMARLSLSQGQRVFFAMGGDGTAQALANVTGDTDAILGLLPAGGGNDFAAAAGIPNHPVKAAQALVHGRIRRVDLARARTGDDHVRLYVGGGGVGLDAEAARYAGGRYRNFPGRVRYIASALHALTEFQPIAVRLEFPGSAEAAYAGKALLVGVLNTPTYGGGLRLAPGATLDDGRLHVVVIEDLTALGILKLLPRLTVTGELRTEGVKRWQVERLTLSTDRPCLFHGDGEILGPAPVEIELAPGALQILSPAQIQ